MTQANDDSPDQGPRRMVPKWTVQHGRLKLAWKVSAPPPQRPTPARVAMPVAETYREAAE